MNFRALCMVNVHPCAGSDQTSVNSTLELQGHFLLRLSLHVPLPMDLPSSIELPDKLS